MRCCLENMLLPGTAALMGKTTCCALLILVPTTLKAQSGANHLELIQRGFREGEEPAGLISSPQIWSGYAAVGHNDQAPLKYRGYVLEVAGALERSSAELRNRDRN